MYDFTQEQMRSEAFWSFDAQYQSLNVKHYHTKRCHSQTADKDFVLTSWSITTDKIDKVGKCFRPDLQMESIICLLP